MIEIEQYAQRAVESPVAQPSELARLVARANRRGRHRRSVQTVLAVGCSAIAVAGIMALSSFRSDSSGLRVTATAATTATLTTSGSSAGGALTTAELTKRLERAGHTVAADGSASGYPFGVAARLLCVDGAQLRVYEYADSAARAAVSAGISSDGSKIELPSSGSATKAVIVSWLWNGSPHFFANGRVIVLVLQDDARVLRTLIQILGPTISPQALRIPGVESSCATTP